MTLREYKKAIDGLVKAGHGWLEVVAAIDDEGNAYHDVTFAPSLCNLDDIADCYNGKATGEKVICLN